MEKGRNSAYVIQDTGLRDIFGSRRDEVAGEWRRWHTEEINERYFLANVLVENISSGKSCVVIWRGCSRGVF